MMDSLIFEGAIFVSLTAGKERSCHCPCIGTGHHRTCLGRITAGGEFQLALIERPLVMPRHFRFPRACYRDQIPVCLACATSIKAVRHDRTA